MKRSFIATLALVLALTSCGPKWTYLFNGKDLDGWKVAVGEAEYTVEDGAIAGICDHLGGVNSFLVTEKEYGDFILEFDFKINSKMNSGMQFRSHADSRVRGYQFEFDPSEKRLWTGGIYDEARRGWLYPLTFNEAAKSANKLGEWNHGRIEAIGHSIRTFVNGVECANLIDAGDSLGFFGLQVHATKDSTALGNKVYWKKIRIITEDLEKYATKPSENVFQRNTIDNTLTDAQVADGWKLLFDGKTSKGWKSAKADGFPNEGWTIADGMLQVWENGGAESTHGGDIITEEMYENFWLSVEFKITKGANSGIKYFVRPDLYQVEEASAIGCEFQILDDKNHPDAKLGTEGNRTLGSLYDLIKSDKDDAWFRMGQWNTAWVKVQGNHVEHWLNGVKILEYERNTQEFNALVACSKYKDWENFGNHQKGHILLQEHGNQVFYKDVMIKELPAPEAAPACDCASKLAKEAADSEGWVSLFDGKSFTGWKSVRGDGFPEKGWGIEDGTIVVNPDDSKRGGDIITEKKYKNFWFSAEFKLTEGANSGIKYFINPDTYKEPNIGCEFQVLDDELHRDAKLGTAGNRTSGSLYDMIRADKSGANFQLYDWNTAWIIVNGNHVEHWLNGVKVVEYDRNTQEFDALVKYSKFAKREGFGNFEEGHILIQDHGDKVFFRNLRIKEL